MDENQAQKQSDIEFWELAALAFVRGRDPGANLRGGVHLRDAGRLLRPRRLGAEMSYFGIERLEQVCGCAEVLYRDGDQEFVVCRENGVSVVVRLIESVRWEMACRMLGVPVTPYRPADSATL